MGPTPSYDSVVTLVARYYVSQSQRAGGLRGALGLSGRVASY